MNRSTHAVLVVLLLAPATTFADEAARRAENTREIHEYFRRVTEPITESALADVKTLDDWKAKRTVVRRQMFDMLGLWPLPEKTDLKPTVTGTVAHEEFVVEKLHFQSRPGLYVTANFYRPKTVEKPLPTILYLCGHGRVKIDGVSLGNKTHYQHHPAWFARHGYCCLILDTLQLGEIEGRHHGTYRLGKWWWLSRGYTPAGVEAWNAVRAIDYLETRPEVDAKRIGVTGRSGGGTGTWWLAALDDRPYCHVPVAGIVDYRSHVVDHCIEGHCDCNYFPNRFRIDAPMYAALVAPRPLLLSNTDKDRIFPLDGVQRVHRHLAHIYDLYGESSKLGLLITEGPHQDTQELRVPAFKWMNRWLKDSREPISATADKFFEPRQLRVFDTLPKDERNTRIDEEFVAKAAVPEPPSSLESWKPMRERMLDTLRKQSLSGWPSASPDLDVKVVSTTTAKGLTLTVLEYTSDENLRLPLYLVHGSKHATPALTVVNVVDDAAWNTWRSTFAVAFGDVDTIGGGDLTLDEESFESERKMMTANPWAFSIVPPRGIGPNAWTADARKAIQIRRRFFVVGKTLDEGRIWDVRRAMAVVRSRESLKDGRLWVQGRGVSAGLALYAGLFEPSVERFDLHDLPTSHRNGPTLINVLRHLDMPRAVALALPRRVVLYNADEKAWTWAKSAAAVYDDGKSPLQFRTLK